MAVRIAYTSRMEENGCPRIRGTTDLVSGPQPGVVSTSAEAGCAQARPLRTAQTAAADRDSRRSLARMWRTWESTVRSLTERVSAIARLERPSTRRARTSCSRGVRPWGVTWEGVAAGGSVDRQGARRRDHCRQSHRPGLRAGRIPGRQRDPGLLSVTAQRGRHIHAISHGSRRCPAGTRPPRIGPAPREPSPNQPGTGGVTRNPAPPNSRSRLCRKHWYASACSVLAQRHARQGG